MSDKDAFMFEYESCTFNTHVKKPVHPEPPIEQIRPYISAQIYLECFFLTSHPYWENCVLNANTMHEIIKV